MSTNSLHISFIGGGNMSAAIIGGLCKGFSNTTERPAIHVVDHNADKLALLHEQFGVTTGKDMDERVFRSDVIVLAVKPQNIREVALALAPRLSQQLVVSIAAGIRIADLSRWLNNYSAIVRTMPNTPALVNAGITGMYASTSVSPAQRSIADRILASVGKTVWLDDEALIDPLSAISGSGPAYVFYFIETLQKAAQEMGLKAEQARELTLATFLGASKLATESNEPAALLRQRVTSKGGSTNAAITYMEQHGLQQTIIDATKAAKKRSEEMGDEFGGGFQGTDVRGQRAVKP